MWCINLSYSTRYTNYEVNHFKKSEVSNFLKWLRGQKSYVAIFVEGASRCS